ncbi:sensor histidine kinase [Enterococcus sp. LJL128]
MILYTMLIGLCAIIVLQYLASGKTKKQLAAISETLDDVAAGNLDRRLYACEGDITSEVVYKINEVVIQAKIRAVELDKAEAAYKKLVTGLSHDIRTPLTSLMAYLDVLSSEPLSHEQQQLFETAKNKAIHLSKYVETLFEWSKLESGEEVYTFEKENLSEYTRQVIADWLADFEAGGLQLQFDIPEEPIFIWTDKTAYHRILSNIFSNILHHSEASCLSLSIGNRSDSVVIKISDNGVGIAAEELPHIFQRLYKCDSARSVHSNGLGLSIAQELVYKLAGQLSVESEQGTGTTFSIVFSKNMIKS